MRPRWYHHAALAGYLAIQVALPLRGLAGDRLADRRDFTWNMYSFRSTCEARYEVVEPAGGRRRIDPLDHFRLPRGTTLTFRRSRLPAFHRYLCEELGHGGGPVRLEGAVGCTAPDGRRVALVEPGIDLCAADLPPRR